MKKAEIEKKKSIARSLYMAGKGQSEIAEVIGVHINTISKWVNNECWKEQRAAATVTRPELVNKLLASINDLVETVNSSKDPELIAKLPDRMAKMAATIQKLDKKASVVDFIETFMAFSKWLEYRAQTDSEITPELIKAINKYQDRFIIETLGNGGQPII